MVNPDGMLRLGSAGRGPLRNALASCAQRKSNASFAWWPRMSGLEAHASNPIVSAELPSREDGVAGERSEGLAAARFDVALLYHPKARQTGLFARRLCKRPDHGCRHRPTHSGRQWPRARTPCRGRDQFRQDDARQCAAGGSGQARRARHPDRGHAGTAVRRAGLRRAAHQGRHRRLATWCARRFACGPTGSSSARCAGRKRSTCSRPGTPAIPAASRPFTPTRRGRALPA